ncbi:MAG: hypothetical protein IJM58_06695 [Muribaculaceae bacterium]|nr:hypothetical protein [Muribaculaceae bacterium]
MTEYELQEQYCSRCERPDCISCQAFASHLADEWGWNETDPAAEEDCISDTDRERYDLQCEIDETAADVYMNF